MNGVASVWDEKGEDEVNDERIVDRKEVLQ